MTQRRKYRIVMATNKGPMTQQRIDLLNDLGFAWNALEMTWNLHLDSFKRFREEYGHSNVPVKSIKGIKYPKLHLWIRVQRRQYVIMGQGQKSHMTPARVKVLESIGFCWDPCEAQWSLRLQELKEFVNKHGHFNVPANLRKLQKWASGQRRAYLAGSATEVHIRALNDIGFNWPLLSLEQASMIDEP
jgi:hypothetical protein